MSDQQPPSKPKPGSLRDRIAAFEKSAGGAAHAPVPRPKPGGISWKPKSPSPPTSPLVADVLSDKKTGNMSASDAKESIKSGGTLKERMAALQNRGGIGAPVPTAHKPPIEKPKWKPPPVIPSLDNNDDEGPLGDVDLTKLVPLVRKLSSDGKSADEKDEEQSTSSDQTQGEEAAAAETEEEERQRRAALAARMARLGGARVGMAPMFGRPSSIKKSEHVDEPTMPTKFEASAEKTTNEATSQKGRVTPPLSIHEPPTAITSASGKGLIVTSDTAKFPCVPIRKDSGSSSSFSADAEAQATRSPPISMPVPSAPRRAAPPRRKAPKTPEAPPLDVNERVVSGLEHVSCLDTQDDIDAALPLDENAMKEHAGDAQEDLGQVGQVANELEHPVSAVTQETEDVPPVIARDFVESKYVITTPVEGLTSKAIEPSRVVDFLQSPEHPAKPVDEEDATRALDGNGPRPAEENPAPRYGNTNQEPDIHAIKEHDEEQEHIDQEYIDEEHVESQPVVEAKGGEPVALTEDEVEEDEEVARRKRVAAKFAGMGGVNPFSFPPERQASGSSEENPTSSTPAKRSSINGMDLPPATPPNQKQSSLASNAELSHVAEPISVPSLEREPVTDSPASPQIMSQYTDEPIALKKQRIESEDDTRRINQDANTGATLTHSSNDTNAREGHKPDREWMTHPTHDVDEGFFDETSKDAESETPPPPPRTSLSLTRPISLSHVDPAVPIDPVPHQQDTIPAIVHPTSSRRSFPPPPRIVPEPPESEEDLSESELPSGTSPLASPSPLSSQSFKDEEGPHRPLPSRHSAPSEEQTDDDTPPLPVLNRRSMQSDDFVPPSGKRDSVRPSRPIPLLPAVSAPVSDAEDSDFGEVLPTPPRHRAAMPATPPAPPNEIPLIVPPPTSDQVGKRVEPLPLRQSSHPEAAAQLVHVPPPYVGSGEASSALLSPPVHLLRTHGEVLDEEEGDPIDPSFHSPSRRTSFINAPPVTSPPVAEQTVSPEEDEQAVRRKTIAERMAKLGGIKFGAAPPLPHVARSSPVPKAEEIEQEDSEQPSRVDELFVEEEEQARKERIAAKIAMIGGLRIGMMPLGAVQPQPSQIDERSPASPSRAPPARPLPIPQTQCIDEQESGPTFQYSNTPATSDECIKVDIEDSEIEEVSHADAQETGEEMEEVPPPVPARGPRRRGTANSECGNSSISPPPPPVPTSFPSRSASYQSSSSLVRQASIDSTQSIQKTSTYKPQSEYVMVEEPSSFIPEEEEEIPPPPPARPSYRPPPRAAPPPPPPPQPSVPISDSISSQWEMPSIPSGSIEFSKPADISLSWPEDSCGSSSRSPPPSQAFKPAVDADVHLSSDDLMTVWGRVGVQICEVATTLFEKSKKSLIGDGTYDGFIRAVLSEVPNAAIPTSNAPYGHLIYTQTGNTVQKRASEILPGDIMVLRDAKLKGHKGLQSYHQNVGIGEPLVGVVSEFEPKKSKVRLFQANQHVGQQTVEAVSYRLEDLKSGTIQVFRVLEN